LRVRRGGATGAARAAAAALAHAHHRTASAGERRTEEDRGKTAPDTGPHVRFTAADHSCDAGGFGGEPARECQRPATVARTTEAEFSPHAEQGRGRSATTIVIARNAL